jgi:hypothetical protein
VLGASDAEFGSVRLSQALKEWEAGLGGHFTDCVDVACERVAVHDAANPSPLFAEAHRLTHARVCAHGVALQALGAVTEYMHERAIYEFRRRRASSIIARSVDANLASIKARLWRPDGRLVTSLRCGFHFHIPKKPDQKVGPLPHASDISA